MRFTPTFEPAHTFKEILCIQNILAFSKKYHEMDDDPESANILEPSFYQIQNLKRKLNEIKILI